MKCTAPSPNSWSPSMPRPATTTWNWSAWWKCGRVTAPGTLLDQEGHRVQPIVGRRLLVRRQGVAVGADIGGVPAGRRRASAVLRARMQSAVRTTAYSVIAIGGGRSGASRCVLSHTCPDCCFSNSHGISPWGQRPKRLRAPFSVGLHPIADVQTEPLPISRLRCRGGAIISRSMVEVRPQSGHVISARFWYRWYMPAA